MRIAFDTTLYEINAWRILRLPPEASSKLPSRGVVMVRGTINDVPFTAVLEPDGQGSHWFRVSDVVAAAAHADVGEKASVVVELSGDWVKPELPADLGATLQSHGLSTLWDSLSPMAQWAWIRWSCTETHVAKGGVLSSLKL